MKHKVIILGAGGHGKVIADIVLASGDELLGFLDDAPQISDFVGYPVLGTCGAYKDHPDAEFVIAIGNAEVRKRLAEQMQGARWYTAIHPAAVVSRMDVTLGEGSVIMANAVVNPGARIGAHCIVNTAAVVEHDCLLGAYVHAAVGAKICGTVYVGAQTWVGAGAVICNNVSICAGCTIGAGAVVTKNIDEPGTYVGVPVRRLP